MNFIDKINSEKPILIAGPTASGKSSLALQLAGKFGGKIINADALQVYENWRILTARPSVAEENQSPHALYGHVGPDQAYSVGHWLREVANIMAENDQGPLIFVGGTGLYFTCLTNGLADIPEVDQTVRAAAERHLATDGMQRLIDDLARHDPQTLSRIDAQNPMRVQRAWEVWTAFGRGLADWQDNTPPPILPLSDCTPLVINAPKEQLTPRIARRFDQMIADGCLDECRANLADWDATRPSCRAIGAAELMAHIKGEDSLDAAVEAALVATRQYAKRQRSWFRAKMADWNWIDLSTGTSG